MQLPHPDPLPTPADRGDEQPDPKSDTAARSHSGSSPRGNVPANDSTEHDAEAGQREDMQPHDTERLQLRLALSTGTHEAVRSFAEAHGISEAGLLDALFHGLETADQRWLAAVTEQARRLDAHHPTAEEPTDDAPRERDFTAE